jgi:hypothetical protein
MLKFIFARAALAGVAVLMSSAACGEQTTGTPPQTPEDVASSGADATGDRGAGSGPEAPAPAADIPIEAATVPVGTWGISIYVPPGARSEHEGEAERHTVHVSDRVVVKLFKVNLPAPSSLAEAKQSWDQEKGIKNLGEGVTPNGAFYGVRTFQARVGVSSMEGHSGQTMQPVARVYAVMAIDSLSRVQCTGYVEHGAESAAEPDIQTAGKVCLSMRKSNAAGGAAR